MSDGVKGVAKRARSAVTKTLLSDIYFILDELNGKIDASEKVLSGMQLKINHEQTELLREIHSLAKNSGVLPLSEKEVVSKIFSGLKMYLDPRDIAVVPHLVLDGIWEHRITAAWQKVVKKNDVVLDVGANFGYYGVLAAQQTSKKESKIVMFEANPHLIPYIKKTLAVNWLNEQCVVENLAISDKKGEVTLNLLKDYVGSSSLQTTEQLNSYMREKMYLETEEKIKVKSVSIDEYCKNNKIEQVDLVKMDIEGYEEIAYEGMRDTVKTSPNMTFFIEFTKDGYEHPEKFYNKMLNDFGNVYTIDDDGNFVVPKDSSYSSVIGDADDWVMPVFSKNSRLAVNKE
ncbi:MAG: FkbM family methyltransferase [Candidatus Woesebacteria bacterium]|jgi:FkbM family methyltransferase